jgi:ferrochelatase
MQNRPSTGVLLVNLGTPDSTKVAAVRRYLKEFLMDPRVIDLPAVGRWLLVNLIILPFRPRRSAAAYAQIWTAEGSPLLVESQRLTEQVRSELGETCEVELAMRYGQPSIAAGLERLLAKNCEKLVILPLYPQYASATTGSIYAEVMRQLQGRWTLPAIEFRNDFFDDPRFIDTFANHARSYLAEFKPDFVLFSYHGLPVRHLKKEPTTVNYCQQGECCATIKQTNRYCYRAQCVATTQVMAKRLALPEERWQLSFQSRLGRAEWIKPYTTETLEELAAKGFKKVAVICPAFVADCLETLEEIGMQAREQWLSLGGEDLLLVPSLNGEPEWARAVADMVRPAVSETEDEIT